MQQYAKLWYRLYLPWTWTIVAYTFDKLMRAQNHVVDEPWDVTTTAVFPPLVSCVSTRSVPMARAS